MQAFFDHIDANRERYLAELYELVSRPSIAAQGIGIEETALWVANRLAQLGAEVQVIRLPDAAPVVWASVGSGPRTLLVYDHYDVQPPEPLEGWTSPPFEPTVRDGKLYARGVADNKSNLLLRIQALESWKASMGELPLRVNFLVEGEEEIGSVHLEEFCHQHPELLRADGCLWETGGVSATGQPTIHCGAKGICYVELIARTARDDLHSANATIVPNAAWRLTWALATLKDRDERVLIPGFYDDVRPPSAADIAALETDPDNDEVLLESFGIPRFLNNLSGMERKKANLFNPTCTICGLLSGYTGPGSKTVLPSEARAKIDFRLVPEMDPAKVVRQLRAHLDSNGFEDIEIVELGHERAARSDLDSAVVRAMRTALEETYDRAPVVNPTMAGTGPMYPVCAALGTPVTSGCGTGYMGTRIHAPDENIRLDDYWLAMRSMGEFVRAFAGA